MLIVSLSVICTSFLVFYTPIKLSAAIFHDGITDKTYSFSDVRKLSEDFGRGLRCQYGLNQGDVIVISSLSDIDMPPVIFGALWAGLTVSTSNPDYTMKELSHQLQDSEAKCVVTHYSNLEKVKRACDSVGISEDRIIILGEKHDSLGKFRHWKNLVSTSETISAKQHHVRPEEDAAFLVYSSGTTGKPKGVRLSHYNIVANILQLRAGECNGLTWNGSKTTGDIPLPKPGTGGDKILSCLPFFHIYGLVVLVHSPLYSGVTSIILPRFNLKMWCQLVEKHKITFAYVVPPIVLHLAKDPIVTSYDLSSLRMAQSGAAPLTRDLIEQVYKRLCIRLRQGYGLSETSPCLYQGTWEDWNVDIGSCGALLPNLEVKICIPVDESAGEQTSGVPQELGLGETGELHVRGPNVFMDYHKSPAATLACRSPDGWFRTGDVGHINERGNLFITDRVKELIKYKGFQVPPAELEGYLLEFPGVIDCAVVGVWHKKMATEVPRAYVVSQDQAKPVDIKELMAWFGSRVASYKKLRGGVKLVQHIPKNASGKILRKILKEKAGPEFEAEERLKIVAKL